MKPPIRLLVAVLSLVAVSRPAAAAEALQPGSWSAQFSVQPNFTLGSFSGSILSLKRHLSESRAIRFGLSFGVSGRNDDFTQSNTNPTFGQGQTGDESGNSWSLGLTSAYVWYSTGDAPVQAYWGGGPFVNFSGSSVDRTNVNTTTIPSTDSLTVSAGTSGWALGLGGLLGVEWLVAKRVGLFAEYGASLRYNSFTEDRTSRTSAGSVDVLKRDANQIDFGGSGARLGLSAYF